MKRVLYEEWHDDIVDTRRRIRAERFSDGAVALNEQYRCENRWWYAGGLLQAPVLVILALTQQMQEAGWGGDEKCQ